MSKFKYPPGYWAKISNHLKDICLVYSGSHPDEVQIYLRRGCVYLRLILSSCTSPRWETLYSGSQLSEIQYGRI
ncbi:MAG: hypothetical protein KME30_17950 [Iphinoe sp. HA4291-MV1]|nr:hypothetical protein [Iphinoe sp. HA4291-MV1]